MDRVHLLNLFWEFEAKLTELHTWYLESVIGYAALHERLIKRREMLKSILRDSKLSTDEFQDTLGVLYREISPSDFTPKSMRPVMKQKDVLNRVIKDGKNTTLLGNQCVLAAYSYWDGYFRAELEKAVGKKPLHNFWGDIRLIRNSLVHGNGIAQSSILKCKLLTWFKPNDVIVLDFEKMDRIFAHMADFRNEVHALSLQPQQTIILEGLD